MELGLKLKQTLPSRKVSLNQIKMSDHSVPGTCPEHGVLLNSCYFIQNGSLSGLTEQFLNWHRTTGRILKCLFLLHVQTSLKMSFDLHNFIHEALKCVQVDTYEHTSICVLFWNLEEFHGSNTRPCVSETLCTCFNNHHILS